MAETASSKPSPRTHKFKTPQHSPIPSPPSHNMNPISNPCSESPSLSRLNQIQTQQHPGLYGGQMGQRGHFPMLFGSGTQFNLLSSAVLLLDDVTSNSAGPSLQGMQAMGMMGSPNLTSQLRANGAMVYAQQLRMSQGQIRQQLSQQGSLNTAQILNVLAVKVCRVYDISRCGGLKAPSPYSPPNKGVGAGLKVGQHPEDAEVCYSILKADGNTGLKSRTATADLCRPALQSHSLPHQFGNSVLRTKTVQSVIKPPLFRMPGPAGQKSLSLTGSQPDATASGATTPGGSSSQGTEATNQVLGKRKIQDLVGQVDPQGRLNPEVIDLLLELADDFLDSATTHGCVLAKHRKSSTLESNDLLLHLENWDLKIPGYSSEEKKNQNKPLLNDLHKRRLDMVRTLMESLPSESSVNSSKEMSIQGISNPPPVGTHHLVRPLSSEQLISHAAGSQMLQQMTRF
ncbi:hypothetical protein JHK82_045695 [Glycine max]|nr:hypothetical protein JHK82_045695 [Glycine max]